jgi:YVTN family beta-propeller protein
MAMPALAMTVSVIDPATNTVMATITVGETLIGVAVSPAGTLAGDVYVVKGTGFTVSVIDPATDTVIANIPVGIEPSGVAINSVGPQAGYVYVTNSHDNTVSVIA